MIIFMKKLFRLLAILTLGSIYLPVVFSNLPSPFHTPTFYLALWVMSISIFYPKLLFVKSILLVYLFVIIYFLSLEMFWGNRVDGVGNSINMLWVVKQISWPLLAILMSTYFLTVTDYYGLGLVIISSLLFIAITSITTNLGFIIYPNATRMLAAGAGDEFTRIFLKMGIGGYGFFTGIAFLSPVLGYYLKLNNLSTKMKASLICYLALIIYTIAKAQLTTALITSVLFLLTSIFVKTNKFQGFVFISLITLGIVFIFRSLIGDFLIFIGDNVFPESLIDQKLTDIAMTFTRDNSFTYNVSDTSDRLRRSLMSFQSFLKNPLIGGGNVSGHAFWLDQLGQFGLLGIIPWVLIFKDQIRIYQKHLSSNYMSFYLLSILAIIVFGLFKGGLGSAQVMVSVFFLVPGIYFLEFNS
jgi:hypothetical protein